MAELGPVAGLGWAVLGLGLVNRIAWPTLGQRFQEFSIFFCIAWPTLGQKRLNTARAMGDGAEKGELFLKIGAQVALLCILGVCLMLPGVCLMPSVA